MAVIGSPPGAFPQLTITQSQTWVPPQDGTVCIHVVGAGGGGRSVSNDCHSGGAGAYAKIPSLAVTTSGSYALVVGVGGVGGYQGANGGAGGSSQISGTGLTGTKTCVGGGAGVNANNGAGGAVQGSGESWAGYSGGAGAYGNGGAVGIYGTGQAGQGGGGDGGGMTDAQSGGLAMSGFGIICGGSKPSPSYYFITNYFNYPVQGDDLCGGGAVLYSSNSGWIRSASGGIGGGGGGCRNGNSDNNAFSGHGGDGIILIQYLPW